MAKRKRLSQCTTPAVLPSKIVDPSHVAQQSTFATKARRGQYVQSNPGTIDVNPGTNTKVVDGQKALRTSREAYSAKEHLREDGRAHRDTNKKTKKALTPSKSPSAEILVDSASSELSDAPDTPIAQRKGGKSALDASAFLDPEADGEEVGADTEELSAALSRPPPVNSAYLPLPWKGRLGYACLNTYLRSANPPVFSSRTCRIASILENRHPLKDPDQPAHATKNRPDKNQPADVQRGQAFVESLCLANARDIPRMLRWNEKYGIRFLRLSSEMFPFASHEMYGYKLAPFASEALAEAGRVAAQFGHRLTTHPGQFTQLGSPRKEVINASIRDLEYHAELLSLLKLPGQLDKDAVMILHMGGIFGDKTATLDRFRTHYGQLSQGIKDRLVLENDDVCYSVHDLLPICEELNIPLVLDFHHHNIVFDAEQIREGTADIMELYPRIKATWTRKGITQKMHYSEPTPEAITGRQRRKHNPRPATLPPCPPDMDLMIEAKDKEQAVFELMRTFKLPGFDTFNDLIPYTREDENRSWKAPVTKKTSKKSKKEADDEESTRPEEAPRPPPLVPEDEVGMGGPLGRVYWPPGMEEWLKPKKRVVKNKDPKAAATTATAIPPTTTKDKKATARKRKTEENLTAEDNPPNLNIQPNPSADSPAPRSKRFLAKTAPVNSDEAKQQQQPQPQSKQRQTKKADPASKKAKKFALAVPTPTTSDADELEEEKEEGEEEADDQDERLDLRSSRAKKRNIAAPATAAAVADTDKTAATSRRRQSGREVKKAVTSYVEDSN